MVIQRLLMMRKCVNGRQLLINFSMRWRDIGEQFSHHEELGGTMFMFGSFWLVLLWERGWNNNIFLLRSVGISPFVLMELIRFLGIEFWIMLLRPRIHRRKLPRARLIIRICF